MGKLLICIVAIFGLSVCLLQLRQQRLHARFEMNRLHDRIEGSQARLWNQQLRIASATTPEALARQIREHGGLPGGTPEKHRQWLQSRVTPE